MRGDWLGTRTLPGILVEHARERPDQPALELEGQAITYAQLAAAMETAARRLAAHGMGRHEIVAIVLPSCVEHVLVTLGTLRAGGVCMPCNPSYTPSELGYQLAHSLTTTVIFSPESRALVQASLAAAPNVIRSIECEPGSWVNGAGLFANGEDRAGSAMAMPPYDQPALILYTSGTTAKPKGVVFTEANLVQWSENLASAMRYTQRDRLLHFFPMYHGNGGVSLLFPVLLRGGTVVMVPKFSASQFDSQVKRLGITVTALNASHVKMVLAHPAVESEPPRTLERVQFSLALDSERRRQFEQRLNTRLIEVYGLTEGLGVTTANPIEGPRKPGSAGLPFPAYELSIRNDEGAPCPPSVPGEILIRTTSPYGFPSGYYRDSEATATAYAGGWLHTGDVGYLDEDGYLYFVERSKDMIKRSGYSIAPRELEACIIECAGVQEAAVVGIPDEFREEAIVAFFVGDGAGPEHISAHCQTHLAPYKQPQHILSAESLPHNAIGKVDKVDLRRQAIALLAGKR